jgi:carboxymethylenebutenolidase
MALREYLVTEIALDHAEGHLTRRDALHRLGLLGLSAAAASGVLAACGGPEPAAAPTPAAAPASGSTMPLSSTAAPGYDVAAALARATPVTFPGAAGQLSGAFAAPDGTPRGAVLVVHENRGLTDHIRAVAGRLAGDGYAALAPDLLSRAGGTASVPDATAALGGLGEADLVSDLQSGLTELGRRLPGAPQAAIGFCFGGRHGVAVAQRRAHRAGRRGPVLRSGSAGPDVRQRAGRCARHLRRAGQPGERRPGRPGDRPDRARGDP